VTVLGSGNPWNTRAQASAASWSRSERRARPLVSTSGSAFPANYASLKLPVNALKQGVFTHLHADHTGDLITLSGSWSEGGRADGRSTYGAPADRAAPGHSALRRIDRGSAGLGHAQRGGAINPESMKIVGVRVRLQQDPGGLEANGVKVNVVSGRPRLSGAVRLPPRLRRRVLSAFGGHAPPAGARGACAGVDLLITSASRPPRRSQPPRASHRAGDDRLNAATTSPTAAGKVF